ncbi:cytochrome P450 [Zopfia rhizophila CBS 207.26]|uniref:Cytochrome P450 n=1 Tax=Zopfia rhizophila CBS 207.26 TaxID=1314779 RepID=A0A6A6DXY1_9PEZI|nr:cytochrome P450 [Zopfia rhizophila CBS 207.26]
MDITALLGALFTLGVSIASLSAIYNVFFHPLAGYPGPKLAAVTRLPWIRALLTGNIGKYTQDIHQRYGKVVHIAPNELSYITDRAWKDIYSHRPGHILLPKYEALYHAPPGGVHGILTAPHERHQGIRRLLSHAFSENALREQEGLMTVYVDLLIRRLRQVCNSENDAVDMVSWYNWTTFDLLGDLAFGEPFGCLKHSAYHSWVSTIFESNKVHAMIYAANTYPSLFRVLQKLVPEPTRSTGGLTGTLSGMISSPIFSAITKNVEMTPAAIRANAFHLIIAGSETTATLLSGVTFYLLRNLKALRNLENEVGGAFQSESDITITSVGKLKYMLAVLDEGMRLYSPIPQNRSAIG